MTAAELSDELALLDWRRQVWELYAAVRTAPSGPEAHALWQQRRDQLFANHPQSPLPRGHALRRTGLRYWPYDPSLRFELPVRDDAATERLDIRTGAEESTTLRRIGSIELPAPIEATIDVWWLAQYGGGLFIPIRDATAGQTTYGGGRYLLDTAKGTDLGTAAGRLVVDLNFLYHPSCRYDDSWQCPLAPPGNVTASEIQAGEML